MRIETQRRRDAAQHRIMQIAEEIQKMVLIAVHLEPKSASEKHNNRLWWEEKGNEIRRLGMEITCDDQPEVVEQPRLAVGNLLMIHVKGVENNPVMGKYLKSKLDQAFTVQLKSIVRYHNGTVLFNDQEHEFKFADLLKPLEVVPL